MSEFLVVENPRSRAGRRVAERVRRALPALVGESAVEFATVDRLGAANPPSRRVVAVGGDGTVNAAASWLLDEGLRLPLGIVPAGTGNNLAGGLGLPRDRARALGIATLGAHRARLDVLRYRSRGERETRTIVQSAALGFPADIASQYDRLRRYWPLRLLFIPPGRYVYRLLALAGIAAQRWREWRGRPPLRVRIEFPDRLVEEEMLALFVGNERSLGGDFIPCPRARVDDGLLDLCLVRSSLRASYLRLFARVVRGDHTALEACVLYLQSEGPVRIELSRPAALLADGDLWVRSREYSIEVEPGALEVVVGE